MTKIEDDDLRWTLRERLNFPRHMASSLYHVIKHDLTRPHTIEQGVGYQRDEGASFFTCSGPLWLKFVAIALEYADAATGHVWCNDGWRGWRTGWRGIMHVHYDLLTRYGSELRWPITDHQAAEYRDLMGWTYPRYDHECWCVPEYDEDCPIHGEEAAKEARRVED